MMIKAISAGKGDNVKNIHLRNDNKLSKLQSKLRKSRSVAKISGHVCMNPAILPEGFSYESYMEICYAMINQCEAIYFLSNWIESKGANLEKDYAMSRQLRMIFE